MTKISAKDAKAAPRAQGHHGARGAPNRVIETRPCAGLLGALCATLASFALSLPAGAADDGSKKSASYPIVKVYSDGDAFWDHGTFDESAKRLYLGRENGITTIDVATGKLTERLVSGSQVHRIVLLANGLALATEGGNADAIVFKRDTGAIVTRIPTGKKPDAAVLDPATNTVVIMDGISQDAVFVDATSLKVLGKLQFDGEPESPVPDGKGHVFSPVADKSKINLIDVKTRKILKSYPLPGCEDASGMDIDPATGVLLVSCANLKALTLKADTGAVLGSVTIDKYPDGIVFDPVRRAFYVPCFIPGALDVVVEGRNGAPERTASVPIGAGAHTEGLDVEGGKLYVPAGQIIMPKKADGRPGVVHGSFKIYVVDVTR
jgi:DNA-binding beta-propeller fold protein YncE